MPTKMYLYADGVPYTAIYSLLLLSHTGNWYCPWYHRPSSVQPDCWNTHRLHLHMGTRATIACGISSDNTDQLLPDPPIR